MEKSRIAISLSLAMLVHAAFADSFFIGTPFQGTVGLGKIKMISVSINPVAHGVITMDDSSEFKITEGTKFCGLSGDKVPVGMFKDGVDVTITATRGRRNSPENNAALSVRIGLHGPTFKTMPDGSLKRMPYDLYVCK